MIIKEETSIIGKIENLEISQIDGKSPKEFLDDFFDETKEKQTEKHYYNLTNGLQFKKFNEPYGFIRIQSTACEQKRWDFIIQDLDNDFLYNLAIGNTCIVYDLSEKKKKTRALYQGLEWIKYVLYRRWFNKNYIPVVNGNNCQKYFSDCYLNLGKRTKTKLDYFKKFLKYDEIRIKKVTGNLFGQSD